MASSSSTTTSSAGQQLDVTVTVSRDERGVVEFSYSGSAVSTNPSGVATISVPQGSNLIVFQLVSGRGVNGAAFLTRPFQYVEPVGGALIPREYPPPGLIFQRNGNDLCTLININTLTEERQFRFFLLALVDGRVHADDPILINQPPEGSAGGSAGGGQVS